jgi:hypothetical protein
MAIDPSELSPEVVEALTELAEESGKNGKELASALREAVDAYLKRSAEVDLAAEYRELFPGHEIGEESVSLERMREILAKCTGPLADDIIADRKDRL